MCFCWQLFLLKTIGWHFHLMGSSLRWYLSELRGPLLITFHIQHSTFNIQHSTVFFPKFPFPLHQKHILSPHQKHIFSPQQLHFSLQYFYSSKNHCFPLKSIFFLKFLFFKNHYIPLKSIFFKCLFFKKSLFPLKIYFLSHHISSLS